MTLGGGTVTTGTITDSNPWRRCRSGGGDDGFGRGGTTKTQGTALLMGSLNVGASVTLLTSTFNLTMGGTLTGAGSVTAAGSETLRWAGISR